MKYLLGPRFSLGQNVTNTASHQGWADYGLWPNMALTHVLNKVICEHSCSPPLYVFHGGSAIRVGWLQQTLYGL